MVWYTIPGRQGRQKLSIKLKFQKKIEIINGVENR